MRRALLLGSGFLRLLQLLLLFFFLGRLATVLFNQFERGIVLGRILELLDSLFAFGGLVLQFGGQAVDSKGVVG